MGEAQSGESREWGSDEVGELGATWQETLELGLRPQQVARRASAPRRGQSCPWDPVGVWPNQILH